jgi:Nucleotidyl transferase AbiEii toxin, Type IV TA system
MEEKEITGHKETIIKATRQVLLEVFKLLENFHESLILIGGWVPIMIIPGAEDKHVGTIDVDLVINDRFLNETGSETIEDILLANDYQHGAEPGRYFKKIDVDGKPISVPVDFLTSEQRYIPRNEFFDITGIHAITSPGCELSFEVNEKITLDGNLPDGSRYSTVIKSAGIVALIVMKAHAMKIRNKSKDAYDIWFCLSNYPGNIKGIAKAFKPHVEKNSVKIALALLSENFKSIDDRGPKDVVKEDGSTDPNYKMFLQQDSFQRVQALLNYIWKG